MYKKVVAFNSNQHANKKIMPVDNFKFAKNIHIASLMINEFNRAAGIYPIVFLKGENDNYSLYALLGLKQEENLFVDDEGRWQASYIPAVIRRYPFMLGKMDGSENYMIGIDEESEFLSEESGQPLVDADGKPTQVVENVKKYLSDIHRFNDISNRFCKDLAERELLIPLNMQIKSAAGQTMNIGGCYGVNEKKFNELSDEDFLDLRKKGMLPLVYAHLISLSQLDRLVRLQGGI